MCKPFQNDAAGSDHYTLSWQHKWRLCIEPPSAPQASMPLKVLLPYVFGMTSVNLQATSIWKVYSWLLPILKLVQDTSKLVLAPS